MDILELAKIGSVLLLGSIIQSSSGFGFGLFAIPILLFMGFDLPSTVTMVIIASAISKGTAFNYLKNDLKIRELGLLLTVSLLALPAGIYTMFKISSMDQSVIKQIIGTLIIILLVLRWKGGTKSRESVPRIWTVVAGLFCGFLNGFANIGGPPLVLWVLAHKWSNQKMRGTIIAISLAFVPLQIPLLLVAFGSTIINPMVKALVLSPTVLLGTWIGLTIGNKISRKHLTIYMQILLLIIAISSIAKPFF
jgi:uncharacterized membrane protein YfcA